MKKPNVIFILADQHNAKCLGHKGHPDVKTPYLDKLAAQGARFDNAITRIPFTTTRPVSTNCADLQPGPQRTTRYHVVVNADNKIHPDHLRAVTSKNYL